MLFIHIIQLVAIVATSFLIKYSKQKPSRGKYSLVTVAGVATFIIGPFLMAALPGGLYSVDSGAIGVAVELATYTFGLYYLIWSLVKIVRFKKESLGDN